MLIHTCVRSFRQTENSHSLLMNLSEHNHMTESVVVSSPSYVFLVQGHPRASKVDYNQ